jgi:hypothetical protein
MDKRIADALMVTPQIGSDVASIQLIASKTEERQSLPAKRP